VQSVPGQEQSKAAKDATSLAPIIATRVVLVLFVTILLGPPASPTIICGPLCIVYITRVIIDTEAGVCG
jgi:hypothetical protein